MICDRCGEEVEKTWATGWAAFREGRLHLCSRCLHLRYVTQRYPGLGVDEAQRWAQRKLCSICLGRDRKLNMDWVEGKIRGLLCRSCLLAVRRWRSHTKELQDYLNGN